MKAAFIEDHLYSVYCPIHTMQLAIKDALTIVDPLLNKVKQICTHYQQSSVSSNLLRETQKKLGCTENKLINENSTRLE